MDGGHGEVSEVGELEGRGRIKRFPLKQRRTRLSLPDYGIVAAVREREDALELPGYGVWVKDCQQHKQTMTGGPTSTTSGSSRSGCTRRETVPLAATPPSVSTNGLSRSPVGSSPSSCWTDITGLT